MRAELGSSRSISRLSCKRVIGVRRSCEIPASKVVRLSSSSRTSVAMVLKRRAKSASSAGPVSGSGSGNWPAPTWLAARAARASGTVMRRTRNRAVSKLSKVPTATTAIAASGTLTA